MASALFQNLERPRVGNTEANGYDAAFCPNYNRFQNSWHTLQNFRIFLMNIVLQLNPPTPPQSMLITLSGTMVISCSDNIVQGGGGNVLPRFGILENPPGTVKCVINFATDWPKVTRLKNTRIIVIFS